VLGADAVRGANSGKDEVSSLAQALALIAYCIITREGGNGFSASVPEEKTKRKADGVGVAKDDAAGVVRADAVATHELHNALSGGWLEGRINISEGKAANGERMQTIDVFSRVNSLSNGALANMGRERQLDEHAIGGAVGTEARDSALDISFRSRGWYSVEMAEHTSRFASFAFPTHVHLAVRTRAHLNNRERWRVSTIFSDGLHLPGHLRSPGTRELLPAKHCTLSWASHLRAFAANPLPTTHLHFF